MLGSSETKTGGYGDKEPELQGNGELLSSTEISAIRALSFQYNELFRLGMSLEEPMMLSLKEAVEHGEVKLKNHLSLLDKAIATNTPRIGNYAQVVMGMGFAKDVVISGSEHPKAHQYGWDINNAGDTITVIRDEDLSKTLGEARRKLAKSVYEKASTATTSQERKTERSIIIETEHFEVTIDPQISDIHNGRIEIIAVAKNNRGESYPTNYTRNIETCVDGVRGTPTVFEVKFKDWDGPSTEFDETLVRLLEVELTFDMIIDNFNKVAAEIEMENKARTRAKKVLERSD